MTAERAPNGERDQRSPSGERDQRSPLGPADLERILSTIGEGIAALDNDLRYVYVNDAAVNLVGMPREAVIGRTPSDLFPPEVVNSAMSNIRRALATSQVVSYELYLPSADRWYENRLYPSPDGATIFFSDITPRKKAEAALRESRDVLALAMRGGRMGAWSRNVVTGEVWWSRELEELFGVPAGRFAGTESGFLELVHEEDQTAVMRAVETALASGDDYVVEFRFRHESGAWRWMEGRGRAVYAADGKPVSLNGIGIDITERKTVEAELAAARDAAEAASRAKDEFMAMLGHELRNPLSPIVTALQLMKLRGGAGSDRERAVIERQVAHLTRLVDDLLDVSRIARGKVELRTEVIEVAEAVARAIEVASPLLEARMQSLSVDVPRAGLAVDADPARLAQVLSNLLTNASKYTPTSGRVAVSAQRAGGDVVVRVRDSGIGIPAEVLPRVFDLFVQGRQAIDRAQGGLGLGLTIVKSLVEAHGGWVEAHSEGPDKGSEFVVALPSASGRLLPAASLPLALPAAEASASAHPVLIVDDNEDAAAMLAESLKFRGFATAVAYDGPAALRVAQERQPSVAVLDIGLPVMDGYELAMRLRKIPGLESLRLVAVTGYGQDSDRQRSARVGFHHHLVKPVDVDRLADLIAQLTETDDPPA